MIRVVISGAQTGVDRAALDAARDSGILTAGWCPSGRRAHDGLIPAAYPVTCVEDSDWVTRTVANVRTASGTLILGQGDLTRGTKRTLYECREQGANHLLASLAELHSPTKHIQKVERRLVEEWILGEEYGPVTVLNVAGPSEQNRPGIYTLAYGYLVRLFSRARIAQRRLA